jgi:superfamily I DNA and/or RNA helicase
LKAGKRIAVSSNSHKAIHNLLAAVEARAIEEGYCFKGAKKGTTGTAETIFTSQFITTVFQIEHIDSSQRLVGGTAFHFAQPEELGGYDYLFIDEAGQVALGNLVAMARCARNIVLVGDQMQLQLPVQGVHPGQSGLSCLDYLMLDHATVPPERGALLDVSWRMHPDVCEFISEAIYEGRLKSHPDTAERYLVLDSSAHPVLRPTGIAVLEVDHAGCTQSSIEEADAIASLLGSLLSHSLRDKDGKIRRLTLGDILIVSPFNAQVNLLRQKLPAGARVGTVDKFQGQEAAVAIVSMATSDGADAPRGSDFLFNINRLNVAVSRAQCLSVIVRSKQLLEMSPTSVADLHRLDGFARADNWHVNHTQ